MSEAAIPPRDSAAHISARHRAAQREVTQRRRRVLLNIAFFIIATCAMLLLSLITRDSQAHRRSESFSQQLAGVLNSDFRERPLPIEMPMPENMSESLRKATRNGYVYLGQSSRREAVLQNQPRVVAYPMSPLRMYLRTPGRHIVVATELGFESRWLNEEEVVEQADKLGIVLIEPQGN